MENVDEYPLFRERSDGHRLYFFPGNEHPREYGEHGAVRPREFDAFPRRRKGIRDVEWPRYDEEEKEEERKREKKAGTTKIIVLVDRTRRIPCTMECNSVITR